MATVQKTSKVLMVCGSRHLTNNQHAYDYVMRLMKRAKELDMAVFVGDAFGVDDMVCKCAIQLSYTHAVCVHGIGHKPRNGWQGLYKHGFESYTERDKSIAFQSDIVMCVWNGQSQGTKRVYDYARSIGKEAHIKVFQ